MEGNAGIQAGLTQTLELLDKPREDDPQTMADYYDDMLYHRTAWSILSQMYQRQLELAESLANLIETQYSI